MAYTYRRTGSARSVGRRRTIKYYATTGNGNPIAARSAAGARMDAKMFGVTLTGGFETDPAKIAKALDRRVSMKPPAAPVQQQQTTGGAGGSASGGTQQQTGTGPSPAPPPDSAPPPSPPPARKKKGRK